MIILLEKVKISHKMLKKKYIIIFQDEELMT